MAQHNGKHIIGSDMSGVLIVATMKALVNYVVELELEYGVNLIDRKSNDIVG